MIFDNCYSGKKKDAIRENKIGANVGMGRRSGNFFLRKCHFSQDLMISRNRPKKSEKGIGLEE
jgi:hypothetical protein